ncbi:uncharacterized protein LOC135370024 isoform X1 [Ornithodoros turicata]|uniref:uncharacterized protein LOC135370024 isoform X1 n=1 Tax=Ornithodoros turicata TaxID=34597 RepID=UPI003139944B
MKWCVFILCVLCGAAVENSNSGGTQGKLPDEITFQLYIAFDNVLHTNFSNENLAKKYVSAFFRAINLQFQQMRNPRIKFEFVMFHGQYVPFTKDALVVEDGEVNAHKSLHSLYNFTRTRRQFISSDIVFVFSGRKVFTYEGDQKSNSPQGLTWEKGICNASRKFVIVSDIGKRFSALPNAAFQLARLLGAPTACTPKHYSLDGNYQLFNLSSCVMGNITDHLRKLLHDNYALATDCFSRKYKTNTSQYYHGLPYNMFDEETFCVEEKRMKKHDYMRGRCERYDIKNRLKESYEKSITEWGWGVLDPVNSCFFDCCDLNYISFTVFYMVARYAAFDGKPCGPNKDKICVQAQCVQNTTIP